MGLNASSNCKQLSISGACPTVSNSLRGDEENETGKGNWPACVEAWACLHFLQRSQSAVTTKRRSWKPPGTFLIMIFLNFTSTSWVFGRKQASLSSIFQNYLGGWFTRQQRGARRFMPVQKQLFSNGAVNLEWKIIMSFKSLLGLFHFLKLEIEKE